MACQKSDCLIVAGKPVKAGGAKGAASSRSQRGSSVGTGGRKTVEQETKGIRYQSEHFPTVQGLMHCVNEQSLMAEHRKQGRRKATGIDGVDKAQYDENAEENIRQLVERMKKFQYKPQPVRRTYIPKANGKQRPLGIPAYEDRLVQGVMEGSELKDSDRGTPQGGLVSPVLANVYLHYVLDLWFEKAIKPKLRGEAYYVRYADDFLILFQYENEAREVLEVLKQRLGKFSLEVAEDKTRVLPIGRFKGTKEDFDFLGFTFFNTKTRGGKYRLGVRTSKKKLKVKRQAAKAWLHARLTKPVSKTMELLAAIIRGHCNYYGVSGNFHAIQSF